MEIKLLAHKFKFQYSNLISLALVFLFPLFVPNSQIITGTIVNATIAFNSLKKHPNTFWYLLIIPSMISLIQKAILGPFSNTLYFFIIPIWISNYVFALSINKFTRYKFLAIGFKVFVLFTFTMMFIQSKLVPSAVFSSMVIIQAITGTAGFALSQLTQKLINGNFTKVR